MRTVCLLGIAVYTLCGGYALGQQPCADRLDVLTALSREYGEAPVLRAMDASGFVMEITASPSGSWSMLVTRPGGPTCMRGSGEAFEFTPRQTVQPGKPS